MNTALQLSGQSCAESQQHIFRVKQEVLQLNIMEIVLKKPTVLRNTAKVFCIASSIAIMIAGILLKTLLHEGPSCMRISVPHEKQNNKAQNRLLKFSKFNGCRGT